MKIPMIAGVVFCVIGMVLLGIGWNDFQKTRVMLSHYQEAEGTVVEISQVPCAYSGCIGYIYTPTISFTPQGSHQPMIVKSKDSMGDVEILGKIKHPFSIDQKIKILYSPQNPDQIKVKRFSSLWLLPSIWGALGILFVPLGLAVTIAAYKEL